MDLLKSHKRKSRLSEIAYVILNVGFALALLMAVVLSQPIWLAITILLLSKWRILAVRPRFWFMNIVSNMVDIIVGLSFVVMLYSTGGVFILQMALTITYVVWLLLIKPRSSRKFVSVQAGIAVFAGITALSIVSYDWDVLFFVVGMWLIGYMSARHLLSAYTEPYTVTYSLIVGAIFAEMGWIGFHWLVAYPIPGFGGIQLSQLALFVTLICFVAERTYVCVHEHGKVRRANILAPILLTVSVVMFTFLLAIIRGASAL